MAGSYSQVTKQFLKGAVLCLSIVSVSVQADSKTESKAPELNVQAAMQMQANDPVSVLRKLRQQRPEDPAIAARLAQLYIQKARQEAAPEYYKQALFAIRPWWRVEKLPPEIALIRATLYQHEHHYAEASELLHEVIQQQPKNSQAWLTLSAIQLVQGDYKKAAVSCDALSRVASSWYGGLCYSQIYSVTGRSEEAYKMQSHLLSQLSSEQSELRIWVTALMAESSARSNKTDLVARHYQAVLALRPKDVHALRNYSDYLLAENRHQEVIKMLKPHLQNDALLLRTAMAAKQAGNAALEKQSVEELRDSFRKALKKHGHTHEKDEALFELNFGDNKQRALKLAQENWAIQKEPSDMLSLLKAAQANDNPQAAEPVIAWVSKHQLEGQQIHALIRDLQK